nr:hypothetical protein [Plectonema radiosum]
MTVHSRLNAKKTKRTKTDLVREYIRYIEKIDDVITVADEAIAYRRRLARYTKAIIWHFQWRIISSNSCRPMIKKIKGV